MFQWNILWNFIFLFDWNCCSRYHQKWQNYCSELPSPMKTNRIWKNKGISLSDAQSYTYMIWWTVQEVEGKVCRLCQSQVAKFLYLRTKIEAEFPRCFRDITLILSGAFLRFQYKIETSLLTLETVFSANSSSGNEICTHIFTRTFPLCYWYVWFCCCSNWIIKCSILRCVYMWYLTHCLDVAITNITKRYYTLYKFHQGFANCISIPWCHRKISCFSKKFENKEWLILEFVKQQISTLCNLHLV